MSVIDFNENSQGLNFNTPTLFAQLDLADVTSSIDFVKIKSDQGNLTQKIIKR